MFVGSKINIRYYTLYIVAICVAMSIAISDNAFANSKYAAYVVDANTGQVLHARHANARRYPASLTKMMTLYLVFEDLRSGKISRNTKIKMSRRASRRPPSKLGIGAGNSITVEQAIYALVTKSANDVASAVAEHLNGSEAEFARRMTKKARQLGMKNTTFKNASGLTQKGQITTAADMGRLGVVLREHFPNRYHYFKTRNFKFANRNMRNHNKLLGKVRGVDGIKTGYTAASGFNLVSSVSDKNKKIVAVIMGGRSGATRNQAMKKLIQQFWGQASTKKVRPLVVAGVPINQGIWPVMPRIAPIPKFPDEHKSPIEEYVVAYTSQKYSIEDIISQAIPILKRPKRDIPDVPQQDNQDNQDNKKSQGSQVATQKVQEWQIQISATPNKQRASDLLKTAQKTNPSVLADKQMSTEPVKTKSGKTLFRARFTGFHSYKTAKNACRELKKNQFECLVTKT